MATAGARQCKGREGGEDKDDTTGMTVGAWEVGTGEGRRHEGKLRQWTNVWISGGLVGGFGGVVGSGLLPRSTSQAGAGGEAGATTIQAHTPRQPKQPQAGGARELELFFFVSPRRHWLGLACMAAGVGCAKRQWGAPEHLRKPMDPGSRKKRGPSREGVGAGKKKKKNEATPSVTEAKK